MEHRIVRDKLHEHYPTHRHTSEFWEELGRTIATFGFLEEMLKKATYAFASITPCSEEEYESKNMEFEKQLVRIVSGSLSKLIDEYDKTVRKHPDANTDNLDDLIKYLRKGTEFRNMLCHSSWGPPNENGASVPFFVNSRNEKFNSPIDVEFLRKIRLCVVELICDVRDSITLMGWNFPGGHDMGKQYGRNGITIKN